VTLALTRRSIVMTATMTLIRRSIVMTVTLALIRRARVMTMTLTGGMMLHLAEKTSNALTNFGSIQ